VRIPRPARRLDGGKKGFRAAKDVWAEGACGSQAIPEEPFWPLTRAMAVMDFTFRLGFEPGMTWSAYIRTWRPARWAVNLPDGWVPGRSWSLGHSRKRSSDGIHPSQPQDLLEREGGHTVRRPAPRNRRRGTRQRAPFFFFLFFFLFFFFVFYHAETSLVIARALRSREGIVLAKKTTSHRWPCRGVRRVVDSVSGPAPQAPLIRRYGSTSFGTVRRQRRCPAGAEEKVMDDKGLGQEPRLPQANATPYRLAYFFLGGGGGNHSAPERSAAQTWTMTCEESTASIEIITKDSRWRLATEAVSADLITCDCLARTRIPRGTQSLGG